MQILSRRVDTVPGIRPKVSRDKKVVSFYNNPPLDELSLDEFEHYAFDRLQLLRKIESFITRGAEGQDLNAKIDMVCLFSYSILFKTIKQLLTYLFY